MVESNLRVNFCSDASHYRGSTVFDCMGNVLCMHVLSHTFMTALMIHQAVCICCGNQGIYHKISYSKLPQSVCDLWLPQCVIYSTWGVELGSSEIFNFNFFVIVCVYNSFSSQCMSVPRNHDGLCYCKGRKRRLMLQCILVARIVKNCMHALRHKSIIQSFNVIVIFGVCFL